MTIYRNSKMLTFHSVDGLGPPHPCEVRISGGTIAVSYQDEGVTALYEGTEIGAGHFKLKLKEKEPNVDEIEQAARGRATLHLVPDEEILEGWWLENHEEGMWRIYLE